MHFDDVSLLVLSVSSKTWSLVVYKFTWQIVSSTFII